MKRVLSFAALALVAACGGGGDGDGNGNGNSSAFSGVISTDDGTATGAIEFTISTSSPAPPTGVGPSLVSVNASGTLKFDGEAAVSLSGDYDTEQDQLVLTGGGYTLGGFFDGVDRLEGAFSGPNSRAGTFVTTKAANGLAFCGHYQADDLSDEGTFSFVISGGTVRGEARSEDGTVIPLDGTIDGNTITFFVPGTTTVLATGTRDGNDVSGEYGGESPGTWSGSVCN
jgi:hypothetical protein